jgi:glycosyltransferase involved in cell wall biosynthesis
MGLPASFTISVCIPTCDRPQLLRKALESALSQTLPACEILIGDDSSNDASEKVVAAARATSKVPLIYFRNLPPLGQAGNTNRLFRAATGECLVLLHDDDLLLPGALADLANCWKEHPELTAAYGKQ